MDVAAGSACGLPITYPRGPIDWRAMLARYPKLIVTADDAVIESYRGRAVYVAGPIRQYLDMGWSDIPLNHALDWQGLLLARGVSPISAVLLTVGVLTMRSADEIAALLATLPHDWWLRRCLPWLEASAAMFIVPCPGWDTSGGVWAEANWMLERGRPVLLAQGCKIPDRGSNALAVAPRARCDGGERS